MAATATPSTIRFTLPAGITANELPPASRESRRATNADGSIALHTDAPLAELALLAEWAGTNALELRDLEVTRPTLEDTYLRLTQGDNQGDLQ